MGEPMFVYVVVMLVVMLVVQNYSPCAHLSLCLYLFSKTHLI